MKRFLIYFLLLTSIAAPAQIRPHHNGHSHPHPGSHAPNQAPAAPLPPGSNIPPPPGMHPNEFNEVIMILSNESFDSNRLSTAKQIVSCNPMSAKQIADVCSLFTFESNRLDFAKFAYHFCVDKRKYYLLNTVFTYRSSIQELNDYIYGR